MNKKILFGIISIILLILSIIFAFIGRHDIKFIAFSIACFGAFFLMFIVYKFVDDGNNFTTEETDEDEKGPKKKSNKK